MGKSAFLFKKRAKGEGTWHPAFGRFKPDIKHVSLICFGSESCRQVWISCSGSEVFSFGDNVRMRVFYVQFYEDPWPVKFLKSYKSFYLRAVTISDFLYTIIMANNNIITVYIMCLFVYFCLMNHNQNTSVERKRHFRTMCL